MITLVCKAAAGQAEQWTTKSSPMPKSKGDREAVEGANAARRPLNLLFRKNDILTAGDWGRPSSPSGRSARAVSRQRRITGRPVLTLA
jgi:hypothetical protein